MKRSDYLWLASGLTLATVFGLLVAAVFATPPAAAETVEPVVLERALRATIVDEWKARALYRQIIDDVGAGPPFSHVIHAEERHASSLADLMKRRGLDLPDNPWAESDELPHFDSRQAACSYAMQAERDNAAIYEEYMALQLPEDVRRVFEHNQSASLDHHLPAFERCAAGGGPGAGRGPGHGGGHGEGHGHGKHRGCAGEGCAGQGEACGSGGCADGCSGGAEGGCRDQE